MYCPTLSASEGSTDYIIPYVFFLFCFTKSAIESNDILHIQQSYFYCVNHNLGNPLLSVVKTTYIQTNTIFLYFLIFHTRYPYRIKTKVYVNISIKCHLGSHHMTNNTFFQGFPHALRLSFPIPLWCIAFSIFPAYLVFYNSFIIKGFHLFIVAVLPSINHTALCIILEGWASHRGYSAL